MTDHHDVVIAGAGPNGLMLACELALAGVRPVVLDALPGPSDEPKANGLVGQVIRQLDMRGLYQTISGFGGHPEPMYEWFFAGMALHLVGVEDNPMRALFIQQPRLVRLLEKRARDLGVDIRWGHELTGLDATPGHVTVAVSTPERTYGVDATYLVGADGGRSLVRKSVGIDFPAARRTRSRGSRTSTFPTNCAPRTAVTRSRGTARCGSDTPARPWRLIFAQFGQDRAMLGTIEFGRQPDRMGPDHPRRTTRQRQTHTGRRCSGGGAARRPARTRLRRINGQNSRQADRYRAGNVLLLGDAAHVHSAMGGPGLNLGMQDAVNLGWKLAAAVNGCGPRRTARHLRLRASTARRTGHDALAVSDRTDGARSRSRGTANAFR